MYGQSNSNYNNSGYSQNSNNSNSSYGQNGNNNNGGGNNYRKKEEVNYEPYNFTSSLGLPLNEFTVGSSGLDTDIPETAIADLRRIAFALKDKGYGFRDRLTKDHPLEKVVRETMDKKKAYIINDKHVPDPSAYEEIILPDDLAHRAACYIYVNSRKDNTVEKFNELKSISKRFKARDTACLYGKDLASPVKFVFIWSPCGSTKFTKTTNYDSLPFGASEILFFNKAVPLNIINLGDKQSVDNFFKELALL